jgi:hypothetical protein
LLLANLLAGMLRKQASFEVQHVIYGLMFVVI